MADFAFSVGAWVDQAKGRSAELFRAIAEAALLRTKELTPVRTGFLRANFSAVIDPKAIPTTGEPATDDIAAAQIGDVIYIANPAPYARRVEYGFVGTDSKGRHYNQPGHGMVQQTVAELPQIADKIAQKFK